MSSDLETSYKLNFLKKFTDSPFSHQPDVYVNSYLHHPIKVNHVSLSNNKDHLSSFDYLTAGACKFDTQHTSIAAIAEYLERNGCMYPSRSNHKLSLGQAVGAEYMKLPEIIDIQGFCDFQFKIKNFQFSQITNETVLNWRTARRFIDETDLLIPAEMAHMNRGNPFFEVTTNGCAIGFDLESAKRSAFCELLERNAVMKFWWLKKDPIFLNKKTLFSKNKFEHLKFVFGPWLNQVELIYLKNEFEIPVVASIFYGENKLRQPAFVMSAACHSDMSIAAEKTLQELSSMLNSRLNHFDQIMQKNPLKNNNFDLDILNFDHHHNLYNFDFAVDFIHFKKELTSKKDYVCASDLKLDQSSELHTLDHLRKKFKENGCRPIYTTESAFTGKKFNNQLFIVRTFDAQIVDLNAKHNSRRWGKLLKVHPEASILNLNQYPHPFP